MPKTLSFQEYTIAAAGETYAFNVDNNDIDIYKITTTDAEAITLLADQIFTVSGTPLEGMEFTFIYGGQVDVDIYSISFFGQALTVAQALYRSIISAYYNGTSWDINILSNSASGQVQINGENIVSGSILNASIHDATIALGKMAILSARGYVVRAGANGAWESFSGKDAGKFLMGNGTDVVSQILSGAITVNGSGAVAIVNGYITPAMLAFTLTSYYEAQITIPTASVLTLNSVPVTIISAPGTGKYIEIVSASSYIAFKSAPYTTHTTIELINQGADVAQLQDSAILLTSVTKATKFKDVTSATAAQVQISENTAVQIIAVGGDPAAGNGDLLVKVIYAIRTI